MNLNTYGWTQNSLLEYNPLFSKIWGLVAYKIIIKNVYHILFLIIQGLPKLALQSYMLH